MTAPRALEGRPLDGRRSVAGRVLAVLDAFDATHRSLSLTALARRAGLPLATAHRLVAALTGWGALERDAAGAYHIGLRLWEVATLSPRGAAPARGPRGEVVASLSVVVPGAKGRAPTTLIPADARDLPYRSWAVSGVSPRTGTPRTVLGALVPGVLDPGAATRILSKAPSRRLPPGERVRPHPLPRRD